MDRDILKCALRQVNLPSIQTGHRDVLIYSDIGLQVTWIGYPNSTGLQAVDYRLTDDICDPPSTSQTFVEELVGLLSRPWTLESVRK